MLGYIAACRDDLQKITRNRADRLELKFIEELRAYYLVRGIEYFLRRKICHSEASFDCHNCLGFALFIYVWHGGLRIELDAIAADLRENLGSPVLSLERERLSSCC
jgi:hypothetical protein